MFKDFNQLAQNKGWNVDSKNKVLTQFIEKNELTAQLFAFASEVANEENSMADEAEEYTYLSLSEMIEAQGWNEDSMNSIYLNFISEKDLAKQLAHFAKEYD